MFRACGFWCSQVSGYDFVLCISVSIVLDNHVSSDAESFKCGDLSPAPGGLMSKQHDLLLSTV